MTTMATLKTTTMATLTTLTTSREVADHQVGEAAVVKRVIKVIYIDDGGGDDDDDRQVFAVYYTHDPHDF